MYGNMKIQTEKMSQAADGAVGLLQSLGNKSRLMIMCQLIGGESPWASLPSSCKFGSPPSPSTWRCYGKTGWSRRGDRLRRFTTLLQATRRGGCWKPCTRFTAQTPSAKTGGSSAPPFALAEDLVKQRDDAFDVIVGNAVIDGLPSGLVLTRPSSRRRRSCCDTVG